MFSERLKSLRKKTALTQEELSAKLGIARTTYSGYERGTSEPDFDTLMKFTGFFKVSLNWLVSGSDEMMDEDDEKLIKDFSNLSNKDQEYILELIDRLKKE